MHKSASAIITPSSSTCSPSSSSPPASAPRPQSALRLLFPATALQLRRKKTAHQPRFHTTGAPAGQAKPAAPPAPAQVENAAVLAKMSEAIAAAPAREKEAAASLAFLFRGEGRSVAHH